MKITNAMVTTAFELPGYTVVESLGVVRGIHVRSLGPLGSISAGLETIFGGKIKSYTNLCERTRKEAFIALIEHAEELGANAIIGIRYDANELTDGVTEVLAYGTAVIVEKKV